MYMHTVITIDNLTIYCAEYFQMVLTSKTQRQAVLYFIYPSLITIKLSLWVELILINALLKNILENNFFSLLVSLATRIRTNLLSQKK